MRLLVRDICGRETGGTVGEGNWVFDVVVSRGCCELDANVKQGRGREGKGA